MAGFLILLSAFLSNGNLFAQEELPVQQSSWYIYTNLQLAGGNFIYNSFDNVVSLYGGVGYQSGKFGISFSIPVVGNKNNFISQSGGMMLPIGNSKNGYGNMQGSGSSDGGMMGGGSNSMKNPSTSSLGGMNWGLGDLFLYSNYQLVSQIDFFTDVIVNANVKFPTASTHMGIGTGQFDFGASVTLRKSFDLSDNLNSFVAIADLGYINFGDPSGITYENPFTYSFGLGKFFNDGEYSLLLYYSAYTEVVKGYDPPRQIALGLNYKASDNLILTGIGAAGLSKFSPAYNFSAGIKVGI
ncbi:MAG: hypothetical protein M1480_05770 [Bacteroidetes bacterium]|nr:hypothetical protein [Bacteroidota bacterium]